VHGKEQETHGKHFVVRFSRKRTAKSTRPFKNILPCAIRKTHGKHMSLPCIENNTHGKVFLIELHLGYSECVRGEKYFVVRYKKTHGKQDLCRAFSSGAPQTTCLACVFSLTCVLAKTHGKDLFVVRFLIVRTANKDFNNFYKIHKNIK
jgi:hypothetical protein